MTGRPSCPGSLYKVSGDFPSAPVATVSASRDRVCRIVGEDPGVDQAIMRAIGRRQRTAAERAMRHHIEYMMEVLRSVDA